MLCCLLQVQEYKDSLISKVSEWLACHVRPTHVLLLSSCRYFGKVAVLILWQSMEDIYCAIQSLFILLKETCSGEVWRHVSLDILVNFWLYVLSSISYSKVISTDNITLSDVHFSRVTELWLVAVMPVGMWCCPHCRIADHQVFCNILHRLQRVDCLSGDIFNFCWMNHHIC